MATMVYIQTHATADDRRCYIFEGDLGELHATINYLAENRPDWQEASVNLPNGDVAYFESAHTARMIQKANPAGRRKLAAKLAVNMADCSIKVG